MSSRPAWLGPALALATFSLLLAIVLHSVSGGREVGDDLRHMYEYYVKIPKSYYQQTYLELIRYLLERQEPAQTMGHPIVRTEFETGSEDYGKVVVGPVTETDEIPFSELESLSERVSLPETRHWTYQKSRSWRHRSVFRS